MTNDVKGKMSEPKVGISLLSYNQGQYIDLMIDSLKKQTFQDFEIMLVDDGSDDDITVDVIKSLRYDKITKKILYKKNMGSPERRRQFDESAKNEYLLHLCADDVLAPDFLEKLVSFLDNNLDYGAVCTNLRLFEDDIDYYYQDYKYDENKMVFPDMLVKCNMLGSALFRKKALEGTDLEWPFRRCYDWNLWNTILVKKWKLGLVPEPLFYYRRVGNSLSHTNTKKDEIAFRKEIMRRYRGVFEKYPHETLLKTFEFLAEIQEGRDWLDGEYHRLLKENSELKNRINQMEKSRALQAWSKVRKIFSRS